MTRLARVPARLALALGAGAIVLALGLQAFQTPSGETPFHARPARVGPTLVDGRADLRPARIEAGTVGSYELRVTIGSDGVHRGGAVLVGFPKAWFVDPFPIPKRLQTADASRPHYLSVTGARAGASFAVSVDTTGFAGKIERFNQTIAAKVTGADLRAGDVLIVTLANTTGPYIAGADDVAVAVDVDGSGRFARQQRAAHYEVAPGPLRDLTLVAPTEAVVGEPIAMQFTAFDRFWNVVPFPKGAVDVEGLRNARAVDVQRTEASAIINWTPVSEGFYFPQALVTTPEEPSGLVVNGNPVRVLAKEPAVRTYWGELHSHSSISADGIGVDPFPYARDAARLDFFAATEHADDDGSPRANAIRAEDWQWILERVRRFHTPDRFVTLLAYESSFPAGHHNVFFRSVDGQPWPVGVTGTVQNLWVKIAAGQAITIPHHTGIWFMGPPAGADQVSAELQPIVTAVNGAVTSTGNAIDWSVHDPIRRPLLEIYSLHGSSELYDPSDSLSYERAGFTFSRSVPGAHYARDAWTAGLELGVVAASDNHSAQPGQPQGGLTAVRASRLDREDIFDALAGKHTYATTGQRLYLDVNVNGVDMGQRGTSTRPVKGAVTIAAPSNIARAELLRRDTNSTDYIVSAHWDNQRQLLQATFADIPPVGRSMYYLRVQLEDPVRQRIVRAWSSPIWIDVRD